MLLEDVFGEERRISSIIKSGNFSQEQIAYLQGEKLYEFIKMINIINGELGTNYDYVEMYKNLELIKGGSIFNRDRSKKKKKENSIHNDKKEI